MSCFSALLNRSRGNLSERSDINSQMVGLKGEPGGEGCVPVKRGVWYDIRHGARKVVKRQESTVEHHLALSIQVKGRWKHVNFGC